MKTTLAFALVLLFVSCNFNYNSSNPGTSQVSPLAINLSRKVLRLIERDERDSLLSLVSKDVRESIQEEQFDQMMQRGKWVLQHSDFPKDSLIEATKSVSVSVTGKTVTEVLNFPFQHREYKDSVHYFQITVRNDELYGLFLNSQKSGVTIVQN